MLRGHDHACIRRDVHLIARNVLDGQHFGSTAVESGLMQVDVPCRARIERAREVRPDIVFVTAHVALAARDDEVICGDAALRHLDAIVAHELDVLRRLDFARDIEHCILDAGNVDVARVFFVQLIGVERQTTAAQLYRQRLLLLDDHSIVLPGQVASLRLREKLEILDLRESIVGDCPGFIVDTDVLPGIKSDVPTLDIRRIDRHHFILRRRVEDAGLDGVEQVIPAPAVGIAVFDFTVVQDELLLCTCVVLVRKISLADFIVGLERFIKGRLALILRHAGCLTLEGLDPRLIGFLGGLQFFTASGIRCVGGSFCLIIRKSMVASAFCGELRALHSQCIQALFLGCRRGSRAAVICGIADKAHFLPECHLVRTAREHPVADGISKVAIRRQIHITAIRDDVTDAHRAIAALQCDIPLCLCIDAGRHGVTVEWFRRCRHVGRDGTALADEVDTVASEHLALSRLKIAVSLQVEIAILGAGLLDIEIAVAREQRHTALITREADVGRIADCAVIQRNVLLRFGCQAVRVNGCPVLGLDSTFLAGKRHRPAAAGRSDVAGKAHIPLALDGDGILTVLQEGHADRFACFDGIGTAGGLPLGLGPGIMDLAITED